MDNIEYNDSIETILKENGEECESLSILHRMSYEKYNYKSNLLNIPVIVLSSAIGFITGIEVAYDNMNIILGIGSVSVGIIKSIDSYFQLSSRASTHRLGSLQFSQINKKIAIELSLPREQRISAKDLLNIIKTDIKNLNDIMALIDDDIIQKYNNKYKEQNVKKPNIVNGLSEIRIMNSILPKSLEPHASLPPPNLVKNDNDDLDGAMM
jgi:hypothetical protein